MNRTQPLQKWKWIRTTYFDPATQAKPLGGVEFAVDGVSRGTDDTAPYESDLDTTALADATHSITARAFDQAGNEAEIQTTITVDNAGAALPPDPATVASALDPTQTSTVGATTAFLYTGAKTRL